MSYTPSFTPQYADGWEDLPVEETPITATALNAYDDAIENIETYLSENDIVDANANIADEYDATATYSKDDYVIYGGNLYKAKQDISTAEAWDSTHWDACIVTDEMSQGGSLAELSDVDLENLADGDIIRYNGTSGKFENVKKFTQTTLWTGTLSTESGEAEMSESYANYDDIIIKWSAYSDGSAYQKIVVIPTSTIIGNATYQFSDSIFRNSSQYAFVAFGFKDDYVTLVLSQLTKVSTGVGSGVIIQEIIGRKY